MQPAGIIFKGSGFYVTDSKSNNPAKPGANKRHEDGDSGPAKTNGDSKEGAKSESSTASATTSTKSEPAASTAASTTTSSKSSAAAD